MRGDMLGSGRLQIKGSNPLELRSLVRGFVSLRVRGCAGPSVGRGVPPSPV
jgi:hypothetical protein